MLNQVLNWTSAVDIVKSVRYKRMKFKIAGADFDGFYRGHDDSVIVIRMSMYTTCVHTAKEVPLHCQTVISLSECCTEEKLVRKLFEECVKFETHEAAEWFTVKGEQRFDPHVTELHHSSKPVKVYEIWDSQDRPQRKAEDFGQLYGSTSNPFAQILRDYNPEAHEFGGSAHTPVRPFARSDPGEKLVPKHFDFASMEAALLYKTLVNPLPKLPDEMPFPQSTSPPVAPNTNLTLSYLLKVKKMFGAT